MSFDSPTLIFEALPEIEFFYLLAGEAGLEPATSGFGDRCSSQLSYSPAFYLFHSDQQPALRPALVPTSPPYEGCAFYKIYSICSVHIYLFVVFCSGSLSNFVVYMLYIVV